MLRSKKDVDRHVQDIFRKLPNEQERTLRCYKIAELYYHVADYESARRYLSRYVEIRKEAKGHKLMGQILEALGNKENALIQYKQAYELDSRQEELVLKVCELMSSSDTEIDVNRAKYWAERADKLFPKNHIVFQLKEKILSIDRPNDSAEDLEKLIRAELSSRPKDVQLRVKLLKHYMEENKLEDAYKYAIDIEETSIHRDSLIWYQMLCELFLKCKSSKQSNWSFWIFYISSLERCAALTLKELGSLVKKSSEAMQAIYNFDQHMTEAKSQSLSSYQSLTESIFMHMWGQLHFHMACLLLQNTQRDQSNWTEAGKLSTPLLLAAVHIKPIDLTAAWATNVETSLKNQLQVWYREGSYRCSQAGHVLRDYSRGNQKKLLSDVEKLCIGSWRERVYQRIFMAKIYQRVHSSYFANNNALYPPLRLISNNELKRYDEVAEEVWPYSLHHQIWPAVKIRNSNSLYSNKLEGPQPNLSSHLFLELQLSVYNLNQASPTTLSRLDIDAFLNAAAVCACAFIEEQQHNKLLSPDRLPTLPADLTNSLSTPDQEKWWSIACKMYRKEMISEIGDHKQHLQRGLEVIRCIGNHGLHPTVLVHLARVFNHRAKQMKDKNSESGDIAVIEARSEMYWSAAVPLLERLQCNQTIRSSNTKLFEYIGKEMNNMELTHAIEEGKLFLAQRLVKDKLYEQAMEALKALRCPEASFEQGKIYKLLADELIDSMPKESVTSEIRSQHGTLLTKAKNCFYLTLDRLRGPDVDPKHPLNSELCSYITFVENELKRVEPDNVYNDRNRNDCDDCSVESYSSAHSDENPLMSNTLYPQLHNTMMHTPMRSVRRTPKQSSTPRHHDNLDISRTRNEARPSPERLDAQIRQLVHAIEGLKEQNREQHRAMMSKLDELIKINAKKENYKPRSAHPPPSVNNHTVDDDLFPLYNDDELCKDWSPFSNSQMPTAGRTQSFPPNVFPQAQRHPYSQLVYPQLQGYPYQGLPFADPTAAMAMPMYPAAAAAYNTMNPLQYRTSLEQQPLATMQQISESLLQQGLYGQKFGEYSQNQPQQSMAAQVQNADVTKNDPKLSFTTSNESSVPESSILKDTLTSTTAPTTTAPRKPLPANVVITTSDTLPTTTPTSQPMLSVTIPPQHRLGVVTHDQNTPPHSYQISMPLQPMIPTTVNLPPLSETMTITSPAIKTQVSENQNNSILSTGSRHSCSSDVAEVEHDPIPDFAPIIPLPDEVPVTTGEENEEELYCARAKLFRFVDKEWKERGIGNVKLLKNSEGKIRLLMRREQVHKICANHMLRKDMELTAMPNNDKAYMWVANDFADEEVRLEKLCIRFKTPEEAANFKEQFDKAKNSLPEESAESGDIAIKTKNTSSKQSSKSEPTPFKPAESKYGGFTFTAPPIIQKPSSPDITQEIVKDSTVHSPFTALKFDKSGANKTPLLNKSESNTTVPFGKEAISVPREHSKILDSEKIVIQETVTFSKFHNMSWDEVGTGVMSILADKTTNKARVLINNKEDTKTLYNESVLPFLIFHVSKDYITWANADGQQNSLARFKDHQQATKFHSHLVAAQRISKGQTSKSSSEFKSPFAITNNEVVPWLCWMCETVNTSDMYKCINCNSPILSKPNSDDPPPPSPMDPTKSLSELFKPAKGSWECNACYTRNNAGVIACVACQQPNSANTTSSAPAPAPAPTPAPAPAPAPAPVPPTTATKSLSEMFKPAKGSWECNTCYTRNNAGDVICVACQQPNSANTTSSAPASAPSTNATKSLLGMFQPAKDSWECNSCYIRNDSGVIACVACQQPAPNAPAVNNQPLSEIFKPAPSSWTCKNSKCNISNNQSSQYCVACDMPKDPSMPPKPKSSGGFLIGSGQATDAKSTFTFGMPQNQTTPAKESTGFNFSFSKPSEKAVSSPISIFGSNKTTTPNDSGFLFGAQPPTTPPGTGGGECTFGSPGKSFDFQFQAKSPPVKSPERPETSDDEQVEESEDVYFAPVIPLPDKVDVKTGEEDEEVLYSHRAKLFKYDTTTKEWKERGLGDIKLLRHSQTKKLRLVMRREQVLKICLNHAVSVNLDISSKDEKTWMWTAGDYSEGEIEYLQFACRFKSSDIAQEFKAAIDDACKNDSGHTDAGVTPVSKPKSIDESISVSDIEVVYEIKVSPEEKAAALKLQLPENFYAYKYKDDCPGCRGCQETSTKPIVVRANDIVPSSTTANAFNNIANKPVTTTATTTGSGENVTFRNTSAPLVFGSSTNSFGDAAKSTGFVFGQATTKPTETGPENIQICSPSNPAATKTSVPAKNIFAGFGGTQKFADTPFSQSSPAITTTTSSNIFNVQQPTTAGGLFGSGKPMFNHTESKPLFTADSKPVFGGDNKPIFGGDSKPVFGGDSKPVFGGDSKPIFGGDGKSIFGGDSKPLFGSDSKPVFGGDSKPVFGGESKPLFGGDSKLPSTNIFGPNKPPTSKIFGGSSIESATSGTTNSIFGNQSATGGSIFGGQTNSTSSFGSRVSQGNDQNSAPLFSGKGFAASAVTTTSATTTTSGSLFGDPANQFAPKINFGSNASPAANLFANAGTPQTGNIFGVKTNATTATTAAPKDIAKKESVAFLPTDNSLSFSALAANTTEQQPAFKTDPNFTFEGAGASVFGAKAASKAITKKTPTKPSQDKSKNDDEDAGEEEDENEEEHDPQFEPIIPLPDAIEVRTGEEDEEKVFCQRAKLFRFDQNTKEWKERGVGEMKLLHHPEHGTYRLLLRREQVHKIVCNMALIAEMKFLTLNSSDKAWMWFGMNYAEPENAEVEQLAVRFKSPELASQFKDAVDKAQKAITERDSTDTYEDSRPEDDYDEDYDGDGYVDEDEDDDDEEEEEEEEEEEDEGNMTLYEKNVSAYAQTQGESTWSDLGTGNLRVIYDSDIFGARIIIDNAVKATVSDTVISMDTTMQCDDKECAWAAVDYALDPPVRRTVKTVFTSPIFAQEMYQTFQEGQECAMKADIRE